MSNFPWRDHVVDVATEFLELLFSDIIERATSSIASVPRDLSGFHMAPDLDARVRVTMLTTEEAKKVLEDLEGDAPSEDGYTGPWRDQWNNRAMDTLVAVTARVVDAMLGQIASEIEAILGLMEDLPSQEDVRISTFSDPDGTHIEIDILVEVDGIRVEDAGYAKITVEC